MNYSLQISKDPDWMWVKLIIIIVFGICFLFGYIIGSNRIIPETPQKPLGGEYGALAMIQNNTITPISAPVYVKTRVYGTITKYNPVWWQTDDTPLITASNKKIQAGHIANNCLRFGTRVEIEGKMYEVQDRMNKRYGCNRWDILEFDLDEALEFGVQEKEIIIY